MTGQDRAEFEAWAATTGVEDFSDGDLYGYSNVLTANCYASWLAARRTQSEQVRELMEAADNMLDKMARRGRLDDANWAPEIRALHEALAQLKEQDDE